MLWLSVLALFLGITHASNRIALPSEGAVPDEREEELVDDLENLIRGNHSTTLRNIEFYDLTNIFRNRYKQAKDESTCVLCKAGVRVLVGYRRLGGTKEDLEYAANKICVSAKIASKAVCEGAIHLNLDTFLYIVDNKEDISPTKVCSILAQSFGCKAPKDDNSKKWSVRIAPGPKIMKESPIKGEIAERPLRILHFTDIHYDDIYQPGGNALCDEPLCCGNNQGIAETPAAQAGNWGDYRYCDTPWHAVLDLMNQTKTKDFDLIYYTGDTINHRVWATSQQSNIYNIKKMNALFRETFGSTPLYPILGNHEPSPLDLFSPENITRPDISTQWLFDTVSEDWSHWLPNSTLETIRKGGYYTTLVRPGYRIIALNSNVIYTFNWWLLYNDEDPFGQLQWLADTLAEAEKAQEIVHILSHVPTGDDTCLVKWAKEYGRIIERFHHIIAVQINGHTHYDEFNVFYSKIDSNKPISVAYNGGSVTTYNSLNPNYRIYSVNSENYGIEDYEEWIFNITEANLHSVDVPPTWYKLYSFKDAYGIEDMKNLTQIDQVVKNIASSKTVFEQYFRFRVREGDPFMAEGCDITCQEDNICRLVTTEFGNDKKCKELLGHSFLRSKSKLI